MIKNKKLINKKFLNVIVFNIDKNISNLSMYALKDVKTDFMTIQKPLEHNKLNESEWKTLYRVGSYKKIN